ncbi:class I SAM-dependent methyltransferase [Pseudonocardia sp. RS010]|uniref:class I SAM-dependent methyltransferase n=1 Tax=Pseudonocardia sp. RS010 TaxID=3385979 RepID=UPI0039A2140F
MSTSPAGMPFPTPEDTAESYWDAFYGGLDRPDDAIPSPNGLLVAEAGTLAAGSALDLGCGFGGDAIWLAGQGWRVTAVDVSGGALRRAAGYAVLAGVDVDWQRHDLTQTFPPGEFDLVCAQFLHSPLEQPGQRDSILRRAMNCVAPGGSLLVTGHGGIPEAMRGTPFDVHLPSTAELRTALAPGAEWSIATERTIVREVVGPDGRPFEREDSALRLERGPVTSR